MDRKDAIAIVAIIVAIVSLVSTSYYASQANYYQSQVLYYQSQSNYYPPYIEVSSTILTLRPTLCGTSSDNVSCVFTGTFNVTFTIIAPHVGTYNITSAAFDGWGSFGPEQAAFVTNTHGASVTVDGTTVHAYPALEYLTDGVPGLPQGGVPVSSNQPFVKTEEISAAGFTLTASESSMKIMDFGGARLSYLFIFSDQQQRGREFKQVFYVDAFILF